MPAAPENSYPHKLRRLYWPFLAMAEACQTVVGAVAGSFRWSEQLLYTIPRFTFLGPAEKPEAQARIGVFGLVHGNQAESSLAILRLLEKLAAQPALARGFDLVCYPLCNPTGYEDATPHNRAGVYLENELWRGSVQPEIRILEEELRGQRFAGIITLAAGGAISPLLAPPEQSPRPFEQLCQLTGIGPLADQAEAACRSVLSILDRQRENFLGEGR